MSYGGTGLLKTAFQIPQQFNYGLTSGEYKHIYSENCL